MSQTFVPGGNRLGFDGAIVFQTDPATGSGVAFEIPSALINYSTSDNDAFPNVVDASALSHLSALGIVLGALNISFPLDPARGGAGLKLSDFLTAAFGPRAYGTGLPGLVPWVYNIIPFSGGTPFKGTGLWFNTFSVRTAFSIQGPILVGTLSAIIVDPNNTQNGGAPTLTLPTYAGQTDALATFAGAAYTNGQAGGSLVTYDGITAYSASFSNNLAIQPSVKDPVNRVANGCTAGMISGSVSLTQLLGANVPVPQVGNGSLGLSILTTLPNTHVFELDTSVFWTGKQYSQSPQGFDQNTHSYRLFGTAPGPTATANHSVVASYT